MTNYYSLIYDIIVSNVYGGLTLTSDMTLTASLISTLLSMFVILLPIIIGISIFMFIIKRI